LFVVSASATHSLSIFVAMSANAGGLIAGNVAAPGREEWGMQGLLMPE